VSESTTEIYFDLAEALLIVGNNAYETAIEFGASPNDLRPLAEVLTHPEIEITTRPERLDVNFWSVDDYISYGKWLMGAAEIKLSQKLLQRTYELGLGPEPQRLYRKDRSIAQPRFKGLSGFFKAVGSLESGLRLQYDGWSLARTLEYVKIVAQEVAESGKRPTVEAFNDRAKANQGPSNEVVRRLFGHPFGRLLDMAGYPEPKHWSDQDYIDWGVRFFEANGRLPYHKGITTLSKNYRGPSEHGIARRFGGIWSFQTEVERALKEAESAEEALIQELELLAASDPHFKEFIEGLEDRQLKKMVYAKYVMVRRLLQHDVKDETLLNQCIKSTTPSFCAYLLGRRKDKKASDLEELASRLGVFDILWPPDREYLEYLNVSKYTT
jgi:hypothetical protein